jgi:site-specific DNA recombinase
VAELEREKIAERTQRGRRARVASGKPIAGPRPAYGYTWSADKTRYLIDPATAPVVRIIFDWALGGVTLRGMATRLHERGIPSPTGQERWSLSALRNLLLRHVYTGDAMAFAKRAVKRPDGSYTRRAGTPDELVPVPNVAEPIVTREELAAVKDRLTTNKAHAHRNNRSPEATLLRAGFAICGHCGSVLAVANRGTSSRSPRYWCVERNKHVHACPQPSIAANLIDGPVWQRVSDVLRDPTIIAREVARHRTDGGLGRDLAVIEKLAYGHRGQAGAHRTRHYRRR